MGPARCAPGDLLERMSKVTGTESSMQERQETFPCNLYYLTHHELGYPGWQNCADLSKSRTEPNVVPGGLDLNLSHLFGTRHLRSGMGRSSPSHPQSLVIHGQSLLLLILVFWNKSIHVFHCRSLPCSPPAGIKPPSMAAHERGEAKVTRKHEKGRNNGF